MAAQESFTILLIGNDITLGYLLKRYAEHSGYRLEMDGESMSSHKIEIIQPAAIIFLSTERLARDQGILKELSRLVTPVLVCSSAGDQARARELGADYCLLHPITYEEFQATLTLAINMKRV